MISPTLTIELRLPRMGETMTDGVIVAWLKEEGEKFRRGESILEVETDKTNVEVPAFTEGVLVKKLVAIGDKVPIDALIAIVQPAEAPVQSMARPERRPDQAPLTKPVQSEKMEILNFSPRIRCAPAARRLAAKLGILLQSLTGSGPRGRITKADVSLYSGKAVHPAPEIEKETINPPRSLFKLGPGDRRITLSSLQRNIAGQAVESKRKIPHFYLRSEINVSGLLAAQKQLNASRSQERQLTLHDFILRAIAWAVVRVPEVNAAFAGNSAVEFREVDFAYAIIPPSQAIIVTVGAVVRKPVVNALDEIVAGDCLILGASCDHRMIDGAIGAGFLSAMKQALEDPFCLLD